jgi:hypothetical protein
VAVLGCGDPGNVLMPYELTIDQQALAAVARALKAEADGKALRRDLAKNLRTAAEPAMADARGNLMGIATPGGSASAGPPLRTTVLGQMKAQARLSGRSTGARVAVRRRGPRGFELAARRLNRKRGWRHPVFGTDSWVQQKATPVEWFDRAMREHRKDFRDGVLKAVTEMAQRLASRRK